jgi:predicted RNase H-like HicB family nuclease
MNEYTAIITREDDWWIGWIEEIPGANAQEKTREQLLVSLKEAARDILALRREQSKKEMKQDFEEVCLARYEQPTLPEWQRNELDRRYQECTSGKQKLHDWRSVHEGLRKQYR